MQRIEPIGRSSGGKKAYARTQSQVTDSLATNTRRKGSYGSSLRSQTAGGSPARLKTRFRQSKMRRNSPVAGSTTRGAETIFPAIDSAISSRSRPLRPLLPFHHQVYSPVVQNPHKTRHRIPPGSGASIRPKADSLHAAGVIDLVAFDSSGAHPAISNQRASWPERAVNRSLHPPPECYQ